MFINLFIHPLSSGITVSVNISYYFIVFIKQNIVNCPCVNGYTFWNLIYFLTLFNSFKYFMKKILSIPHKMTFFLLHSIFKTIYFLQIQLTILQRAKNMSSTGSSNVYCKIIVHMHPSF